MKKIFIVIAALILSLSCFTLPAMAKDESVEANILKTCASKGNDGKGSGIACIFNLVVDILTVGVGVLGVIGISVVGVQYLTAGGSEEKTRKAKRRMFEIVIGLVAYAVIYVLLKFLLPNYGKVDDVSILIFDQIMLI
ncbi:hypothetical protein IJH24_02925 [Candidatus Saccharibacteria bacterium]|nr:hypothetical protein [Candidatus Saccharibacteria bacterium]